MAAGRRQEDNEILFMVLLLCNFLSAYYTAFCIEASTKRYHWFYKGIHQSELSWYATWYSCQTLALLVSSTNVMVIWAMGIRLRRWLVRTTIGLLCRTAAAEKEKADYYPGSSNERERNELDRFHQQGPYLRDNNDPISDNEDEDDEVGEEEIYDENPEMSSLRWPLSPSTPSSYYQPATPGTVIHHHHHHHNYYPERRGPSSLTSQAFQHQTQFYTNTILPIYHNTTCPFTPRSFIQLLKLRLHQLADAVITCFQSLSGIDMRRSKRKQRRGISTGMCGDIVSKRNVSTWLATLVVLGGVAMSAWHMGLGPFWLTTMVNVERGDKAIMIPWNN